MVKGSIYHTGTSDPENHEEVTKGFEQKEQCELYCGNAALVIMIDWS